MSEVTQILDAIQGGDPQAAAVLLPLVYDELRKLAAGKMANERPGHTLQPTALVHEAWLRMVANENPRYQNRAHFFAVAAEAMRRILIESARRKRAVKHGGGQRRVDIQNVDIASPLEEDRLIEVNDALDKLAGQNPIEADLVKLRYFVGMTNAQAAEALGITEGRAKHYWIHARTWLFQEISASRESDGPGCAS
jgi:RNA polymerase sigma factor (TIGR02999 family)